MYERRLASDILEGQFDATEVEVLRQDDETRIICTRAAASGQVLEISQVTFLPAGKERFHDVHQAVLAGESMGKAFRQRGISFHRKVQAAYSYGLPPRFERWFGNNGQATIIEVAVVVGPDDTPYANILETFSPAVDWPDFRGHPTAAQLERIVLLDDFLSDEGSQA